MQLAAGLITANTILIEPSADGRIVVETSGPNIEVVIDTQGWWGPATSAWQYGYDPDGLRVTKTAPDGTRTTFDWDKSTAVPKLVAETTNGAVTRYVYGPTGVPVEQVNPDGSVTYLHTDQLGSVVLLTNEAGTTTGTATYLPYGQTKTTTGVASKLGYAGEYTDPETGFVYLRARFYDPTTGQFLSQDPLVAMTGQPYQYAANNPTNLTDPIGLFSLSDAGRMAWEHRDTIITVASVGVCLYTAGVGCVVMTAVAVGFRAQKRFEDHDISRKTVGLTVVDAVLSFGTLGLVKIPGQLAVGRMADPAISSLSPIGTSSVPVATSFVGRFLAGSSAAGVVGLSGAVAKWLSERTLGGANAGC